MTMRAPDLETMRVFKTAWFAKAAGKARIGDKELCLAVSQASIGQADDLGGGVFTKRLNKNQHRGVILANGGRVLMIRTGKGKKAIRGVFAEMPSTAMAQPNSAARRIWQKTAEVRLPIELKAGLEAVLNGASPPSDSGSNS